MEIAFWLFVGLVILGWAWLGVRFLGHVLKPTLPIVVEWEDHETDETYGYGHVKLSDIDIPLDRPLGVGELSGDEDAAMFWGTHPAGRGRREG